MTLTIRFPPPVEGSDAEAKHLPFLRVLDEMRDLHLRKSADYSPGDDPYKNFRQAEEMGISAFEGVIVRLLDKVERIKSLQGKHVKATHGIGDPYPAVLDETLRDTLIDLCVYGVIALCLFDEEARPTAKGSVSPCDCQKSSSCINDGVHV